jgi:FhuF-like iron-sulfur protein
VSTHSHPLSVLLCEANRNERWLPVTLADIDFGRDIASLMEEQETLLVWGRVIGEQLGAEDARVGPTLLFERLVNLVVLALIGPYMVARRVPLAGLERMQPEYSPDRRPEELTLVPGPFACLTGDAVAGHQDARPLASADELLTCLREQLIRANEPLVQVMARPSRRGLRTQWRCVTDKIATIAWYAGKQTGSEAAGLALAEALCIGREPLIGRSGFRTFEYDGVTHLHRVRNTCCQHYRIPGKQLCFTCPLVKPKDRDQFWRERYDEKRKRS